jgi:hypothetical protein
VLSVGPSFSALRQIASELQGIFVSHEHAQLTDWINDTFTRSLADTLRQMPPQRNFY